MPGEVDLAVSAGDLVVGDARVLHYAHANTTGRRLTGHHLVYVPRYNELPDRIRAGFQSMLRPMPDMLAKYERESLVPLLGNYRGSVQPAKHTYDVSDYLQRQ